MKTNFVILLLMCTFLGILVIISHDKIIRLQKQIITMDSTINDLNLMCKGKLPLTLDELGVFWAYGYMKGRAEGVDNMHKLYSGYSIESINKAAINNMQKDSLQFIKMLPKPPIP